jgi:protein TonB
MAHASPVIDEVLSRSQSPEVQSGSRSPIRFTSLLATEPASAIGRKSLTLAVSVVLHAGLAVAVVVGPLLYMDALPNTSTLKAFFVAPLELAPAPPPPPPPPAGSREVTRAAPRPQPVAVDAFVAPIEVPEEIRPEESLDLGVEGGLPGGVEGGVPGGVVGGIVGGLPDAPPPPPTRVVRVGGQIRAPKVVRRVDPVYPQLAAAAGIKAVVIIEAHVDTRGSVKTAKVLRGHPLFDEPAMTAVMQWRYQPLLLNGEPTEFILNVTVMFNLRGPG